MKKQPEFTEMLKKIQELKEGARQFELYRKIIAQTHDIKSIDELLKEGKVQYRY